MDPNFYVVIMAGGIGSRFWPYSRNDRPKQFLDVLNTGQTLLQMTANRFRSICPPENIYIVTNSTYVGLVKEQLPYLGDEQILAEPVRRNTAPCVAYAAYKIRQKNPDATMVVAPSDHAIFHETEFVQTIQAAMQEAAKGDKLITLGIRPNRPETGYGYIQYVREPGATFKKVKTFTEKPQLELAKTFLDSGDFVWNAGIFIWHVSAITSAFDKHLPELAEIFEDCPDCYYSPREEEFIRSAYSQSKNISIDYGIMEKAENVYVVLADFGWSDLGSWASLHEIRQKDGSNNAVDGNAVLFDVQDCMIKSDKDHLLVVQGLQGYLVAQCDDVIIICDKDDEARFREYVNEVKAQKGERFL
ncbi:mannose-1-phosphate guanylyltransferase [Cesiribacter andamanensis]|uniref:mannose-1-phosphate guanylyltransferase n=1 Tax=Cesiribacter andamanensis AMV16 TaxID=1279009 RepID=M7NAK9_9BACT|nr:mannose-1-phosphate guanylyltransferase [Cesiribacter andamanensis]EMR04277.1 Alginate biosynthesis protein AlgA [Cesiribacter andamanensis AMV16]